MTGLSLSLVLFASLAHSTWNLLLKRSGDKEVFVWCLLATIILHILYFVLLGRGYTQGNLSLVYPIARGVGPMLVPVLAVVFLDETVALPAILGIATIVAGCRSCIGPGFAGRCIAPKPRRR